MTEHDKAAHVSGEARAALSRTLEEKPMIHPTQTQPTADVPLETLEAWRDQVSERIGRLINESDAHTVENFRYHDARTAARVRGRLLCSMLRRVDFINRAICAQIAPAFALTPSEGFSDRVMRELGS